MTTFIKVRSRTGFVWTLNASLIVDMAPIVERGEVVGTHLEMLNEHEFELDHTVDEILAMIKGEEHRDGR